ncbi:MAG TPA: succinyldiaminopimelate transaminase [Acidimicrobiia bacterium]|jgi:succinyldiaminopimelate transaminase|nr:succinyldiaminopimelate transaminase [Acidimicrobiia bacterium]
MPSDPSAFVPPPYPHDRLGPVRATAAAVPGGMLDASVGTPVDPMPAVVLDALAAAAPGATGYPATIGSPAFRDAAVGWVERRFGCPLTTDDVIACIGTKEVVASLPRMLSLRDPSRDTVLYPAVAYPTYEMGALLAGLRAVPVPVDDDWHLDLARVDPADADRALLLWLNDPSNPTGAVASPQGMVDAVEWARARGVVVASDECYAEFTYDAAGAPTAPVTALHAGADGVLVVHSLSKRSNMAGLRAGFVAGDRSLVGYLGEMRKHGGLMMPAPIQAAAAAALGDDEHVREQQARYARRRAIALPALESRGLVHDGGSSTFYLWLRDADRARDGWAIAEDLATTGLVVAPGDFYGTASTDHVRVALTLSDDQVQLLCERAALSG